jgi:hypothetical protein
VGALGSALRAGIDLVPRYRIALQAQGIMAKPKRVTKALDKSNSQRIIETLLMFAPAPIRAIASSPLGSRIIMTLGAGLLATGAMSVDWKNGIPQLQFHKDKIGDATQNIADEMDKQGFTWPQNTNPGSFTGDGQQTPVPTQNLPGYQASYQPPPVWPPQQQSNWPPPSPQQNYPQQNWPPQVPQQNYPPQNYPPQNYPPQNYPPQNYPPVFPPTQNGSTLPPGYGYGQAQNPAYPPSYYR